MIDYTRPPKQKPAGVSLGKVTLTKAAPSVSLSKAQGASGQMRINLNWNQRPGRGFFGKAEAVDLDLGCLWETTDGDKGVVQALGNSFGDLDWPPYVLLDGDDRSGANSAGENLIVNLDHLDDIKRILVFAYIYDGAPNWAAADGVVTLQTQNGREFEVRLDDHGRDMRFCAIAKLSNQRGHLNIEREIRYLKGSQRHLDEAYGWGLRWTAGSK
jgi:tellurite resistance protein TerA